MSTTDDFIALCNAHGSTVLVHRADSVVPCPCMTPEGFRNPAWHFQHPDEPVCDPSGMLSDPGNTLDISIKGFIQPVQSGAVRRLTAEDLIGMFGEIQTDDHVGILPCSWHSTILNFYDWGLSGEDYLTYNGRSFQVVSTNLIPAPDTGHPRHHWELGLRLIDVA